MGTISPLHISGGAIGPRSADDDIDVIGTGGRTDGFHQQIDVRRIARHQQVGVQPLDGQHPAQLTHQVAVLALGQHGVEGLLIGLPGGLCPSGRLGEFLFRGEVRETRFDPADGIDIGSRLRYHLDSNRQPLRSHRFRFPPADAIVVPLRTSGDGTMAGTSFVWTGRCAGVFHRFSLFIHIVSP